MTIKYCPCSSQKRYLNCCGQYLCKTAKPVFPDTAEALMRSRFVAYLEKNFSYIQKTMKPPALLQFNKKTAKNDKTLWRDLSIINTSIHPENPNIHYVEFKARYQLKGQTQILHEKSEFHYMDNRWFYVDGIHYPNEYPNDYSSEKKPSDLT